MMGMMSDDDEDHHGDDASGNAVSAGQCFVESTSSGTLHNCIHNLNHGTALSTRNRAQSPGGLGQVYNCSEKPA